MSSPLAPPPQKKNRIIVRQAHCASACERPNSFRALADQLAWDDGNGLAWSGELGGFLVHLAESGAGSSRESLSLLRHST